MFYTYNQNNSGGRFHFDENAGLTHYVIIEADDLEEANYRAGRVGIYFNGCEEGRDCDCCGDRWHEPYLDPDAEPTIYGTVVSKEFKLPYKWMDPGKEICVHYKDGHKEWF